MILAQVDKRDAGSVDEFRLVLNVDNLPFRIDRAAVHYDCEVVSFTPQEHVAGLDLHTAEAEI